MDLFIMNRYLGDEEEGSKETKPKNHLADLLSRIEERRKKADSRAEKLELTNNVEENGDHLVQEDEVIVSPKRGKKRKRGLEDERCEEANSEFQLVNPGIKEKRKKKKRKTSQLEEGKKCDEGSAALQGQQQHPEGFTILGGEAFEKKRKVKRVLPYWLAYPSIVSGRLCDSTVSIHDLPGLDKDLVKRLKANNIDHFFPVQRQVIPWLLSEQSKPFPYRPRDVCVSAATGSGKTLAFVLPIIQALKSRVMRHIRALVLLPVQELASQVYQVFKEFCTDTDLKVILLTKKKLFKQEQEDLVKRSAVIGEYSAVDVVITTPGRLIDHINGTRGFSLKYLKFLVIDEADRVMNDRQSDWLYHVENHINKNEIERGMQRFLTISSLYADSTPPQKLLFSATLSQDPEKLEQLGLFQPKLFTAVVGDNVRDVDEPPNSEYRGNFIGKYTTPEELTEHYYVVRPELKPLVLYHLISSGKWHRILCFTKSQKDTHRLALLLKHLGKDQLTVGELSSSCTSKQRSRMLRLFAEGCLDVLVSTDALARGIDIPDVNYVVLYNAPNYVKTYIHRVGRTARAGKQGNAVTLVVKEEMKKFRSILKSAGKTNVQKLNFEESDLEYLENKYVEGLNALRKELKMEEWENKQLKMNEQGYKVLNKFRSNKQGYKVLSRFRSNTQEYKVPNRFRSRRGKQKRKG